MKARALLALLVAAAALGAAGCGGGGDRYRVDAVFDSAGFLTPDTDVRIAGAKVGKVVGLSLTRDHKALVGLSVDKRFAPFHADADCTIAPQSLISEKFVDCSPGTSQAPALKRGSNGVAVLPVTGTHAPVDLDLVLNIFRRPVRERLTLLLDALGSGLAARGDDLNQTILRAAPALQATRKVLTILDDDRAQLKALISNSDTVLRSLAAGRGRAAAFVREAGHVAARSGVRRANLARAVQRLPALLKQARPAFADLTTFAKAGTPLAQKLRTAAPGLHSLVEQLGPFSRQTLPGVRRLGAMARQVDPALDDIAPQVRRLRRFAAGARPAGALLSDLLRSVRDQGVVEGISNVFYYGATATARFDAHSHMLPAYQLVTPCSAYAKTPDPACDSHYDSFTPAPAARSRKAHRHAHEAPARPPKAPAVPSAPKAPSLPQLPRLPDVPLPKLPAPIQKALDGVLGAGGGGERSDNVHSLLDYLLR